MVEGPYGNSEPLHKYENCLFITGGTGISGAIPYLLDHISKSASNSTKTSNISLIFTAKQVAMIRYITSQHLRPCFDRNDIQTTFYVTSTESSMAVNNKISSTVALPQEITLGRPDITTSITDFLKEVKEAGPAGGRTAVFVCGPATMADEARAALHQVLKSGKQDIAYFEETFGW